MAIKLNEKTEIRVSLKTVIAIIAGVFIGAYAMFHIEDRISTLEQVINKHGENERANTQFRQSWKAPIEDRLTQLQQKMAVLDVELRHLKEQIQELKSRLK